ncbi:hypothetical protein NPX13_g1374 [Xylaria arbuscula]|uniref:Uncharacterized protein n=1 Tax=Xylaria arbuscula TaxID=114810 RepID=A0A9W8NLK9_9PEZI|nr:hypothetical protein NPX13_g1374 [Xylaria arbuscula]
MKNCGRVIPSELRIDAFCDSCSVKKQRLRGEEVGKGALRVRKQGFQEIFQEERKEAARNALHKFEKERHHPRNTKTSNHDIIHVESSVWLSDLYYHPETLARKEAYARQAARAPPVSQTRQVRNRKPADDVPPKPPPPVASSMKIQERHREKKKEEEAHSRRGEYMPSYGTEKPLRRPLPPAAAHERPATKNDGRRTPPSLPPAVGPSSRSPPSSRPEPRPHHPQPQRKDERSFIARAKAKGYPDPRTHWPERYSPPHPQSKNNTSSPPSSSKPSSSSSPYRTKNRYDAAMEAAHERNEYLHARYVNMRRVEDELMYSSLGFANRGPNVWKTTPSHWDTRKAALADIIEKTRERRDKKGGDADSEISFVCQTSRAISGDKNEKKRRDDEGKRKKSGERQRRRHG